MNLILILYISLTAVRPAAAQSCTSVTITSQADADSAFNDCNDITGSVTISSSAAGTLNLDGLESVTEDLIIEDTGLVGITVPDIEDIGGSVSVTGNEQLNSLGLDSISTVAGDLKVQGNNALVDLRMNDLETVKGGMHLDGGFNTLSFDNLDTVTGESDIVATGSAGCSGIDKLNTDADNDVFQGSYTCATTTSSSPTSSSTSSSSSTSTPTETDAPPDSSSGLSGGAIAGIVVGVVVGVIILLILAWLFLRRRRKNRASAGLTGTAAIGNPSDEEKQTGSQTTSQTSTSPPIAAAALAAAGAAGAGETAARGIPRRPLSTATALSSSPPTSTDHSFGLPSSLMAGSAHAPSMPLPIALVPGTNGPASGHPTGGGGGGGGDLFFNTAPVASGLPPCHQPSESDVPMLDSEDVHEVPAVSVQREQERPVERVLGDGAVFELDGGFGGAGHQRVIHGEGVEDTNANANSNVPN
ncbi:hypothetical protein BJX76DRAFT_362052 [Aspergillus varians]